MKDIKMVRSIMITPLVRDMLFGHSPIIRRYISHIYDQNKAFYARYLGDIGHVSTYLILMSNEYSALQFPTVNLYQLIQKNKDT